MMTKLDLDKKINDIKIDLWGEAAPQEEMEIQTILALHHISKQSRRPDGFWVSSGKICQWLLANGIEIKPVAIGHILKRIGFKIHKRKGDGIHRWIEKKTLLSIIEARESVEVSIGMDKDLYRSVKQKIFSGVLEGKTIEEIDGLESVSSDLIDGVMREYFECGEDDARKYISNWKEEK